MQYTPIRYVQCVVCFRLVVFIKQTAILLNHSIGNRKVLQCNALNKYNRLQYRRLHRCCMLQYHELSECSLFQYNETCNFGLPQTVKCKKHWVTIPCKWSFVLWKAYAENHLIKNHDNWFLHKIEENERGFPICKNVNNRDAEIKLWVWKTWNLRPWIWTRKYCSWVVKQFHISLKVTEGITCMKIETNISFNQSQVKSPQALPRLHFI